MYIKLCKIYLKFQLSSLGFHCIDGLDPNPEMRQLAAEKNVYQKFIHAWMGPTKIDEIPDGRFYWFYFFINAGTSVEVAELPTAVYSPLDIIKTFHVKPYSKLFVR
jgi:hypothetical protein